MTYRSVNDTENVSRHFFFVIESAHVNPRGHLLKVMDPV